MKFTKFQPGGWRSLSTSFWGLLPCLAFGELPPKALPAVAPKAIALSRPMLPEALSDPLEPVNRFIWKSNGVLLNGVVAPASRVYKKVVPSPVRLGVDHVARNISYPGRLLNHGIQGRWDGAGVETKRFLVNSTLGVAGIFDVASDLGIPKSEASFEQTFRQHGWQPNKYVVLPFLGPSDDRNAIATGLDKAAEPWNYGSPWNIGSSLATFDRFADKAADTQRLYAADGDFYALARYAWTYAKKDTPPDLTLRGPRDAATLETLAAVATRLQDPHFAERRKTVRTTLSATGKKLAVEAWFQPKAAPIVYIVPGLSGHRLSMSSIALAEALYQKGLHVVSTTSVYHPEFQRSAATQTLPGNAAADRQDLLASLLDIDARISRDYAEQLTQRILVGYSMGGFFTMQLAADGAVSHRLPFDQYLAINPPVDLLYGEKVLDSYFQAPAAWPEAVRQQRVNNSVHKAVAGGMLISGGGLRGVPLEAVESKYLIGLAFRLALRDIIYTSQSRQNLHLLQHEVCQYRREPLYQEIMGWDFQNYRKHFVAKAHGLSVAQQQTTASLKPMGSQLARQSRLQVIATENDFLLAEGDVAWLRATFGSRLRLFPTGGHLGNMNSPAFHQAIFTALHLPSQP
jgi:ABC-type transporter lipoprotein component MlaA/pimeloyl-ACP methyl ester carboxylesterase